MSDALKDNEIVEPETPENEGEITESREDKVKRIKSEMDDLRKEGLTDAEIKEIAGEIESAGNATEGETEAKEAAEEISEELEEEYDIVLSDSEVDRLAKRIIELQSEGSETEKVAKKEITKKVDTKPTSTHWADRKLWGG